MRYLTALSMLVLLAACGNGAGNDGPPPTPVSAEIEKFRDDAVELQLREELDVEEVTVQLILIGVGIRGAGPSKGDLSLIEAEMLAADVYAKALKGEDFDQLVLENSYGNLVSGQRPGMFTLLRGELPPNLGPTVYQREMQEDDVWKAAWRLQPGEIGTVERHHKTADAGYYVIRRLNEAQIAEDDPANYPAPNDAVKAMRADAAEVMAREEHDDEKVTVQHILIARWMSPRSRKGTILRPKEAEELAAEVYGKALKTDDFTKLVREYSFDDLGQGGVPGVYELTTNKDLATRKVNLRSGMVKGFGDVVWRLKPEEIGVLLYDRAHSPYGYHIIKRVK